MPTLQQVRNRVDSWFTTPLTGIGGANRWQYITARQETFFTNNGRYWQGLRTHTGEIDYDDNSTLEARTPDNLTSKPTNETQSWVQAIPALDAVSLPMRLVMDVYENEDGHGWVLTLYIRFKGTIYKRTQNGAGTEVYRTQPWSVYDPDDDI